jgi:hypothetical protein
MKVSEAIQLLHLHKHHVHGGSRRAPPLPVPLDVLAPGIMRKFRAIAAARALSAAQKAKSEAEWAARRGEG